MTPYSPALRALYLTSCLALLSSGCDVLTSDTTAITVFTRTPDVTAVLPVTLRSMAVFSGAVEPQAAVVTAVLRRERVDSQEFEPVVGASVSLGFSTAEVALCASPEADAAGSYRATSVGTDTCVDATLLYTAGQAYTSTISSGSDSFSIRFTPPPPIAVSNISLAPALLDNNVHVGIDLKAHPRGGSLTVDWSADPAAGERPVFVSVFRVRLINDPVTTPANWQADSEPVFDNAPRQPSELLDLLIGTPPSSLTVPGSNFGARGVYIVVVTGAELSTDTTGLALGSGALAGVGTPLAFWVE